jgi:hypothetical protein
VKLRGTCLRCGRDFLTQQVVDNGGHCWNDGKPYQPEYTALLPELLEQAEAAGTALEAALEKLAGMNPLLVLDEETVLGPIRAHLGELRADADARARHAAEVAAR